MRAIIGTTPGGPEVLELTEVPDPTPGPGQVLVRVAAAGVNRADLLQRQGFYPPPPGASPILGLECSGTIVEVGAGVDGWSVGDRVAALLDGGGYAELVLVPAEQLLAVPDDLDLVDAAALPEAVCTAWSNLVMVAGLAPGEVVLIHGGSGGVGSIAIQLAATLGARVIATAGSRQRADRCEALGASAGIDYRGDELVPALMAATGGRGADVILDVLGAGGLATNLAALAVGGRLIIIGMQQGRRAEIDLGLVLIKRARIQGTTLRSRPAHEKAQIVAEVARHAWPQLDGGAAARLRPVVHERLPLADAGAAHTLLDSGAVFGKVLLVP